VAVCINSLIVLVAIVSSYVTYILPGVPGKLLQGDYAVATVHAIVGLVGLLLGMFIVLRGNNLVPQRLRFKNYKAFMWTSYVLYILSTLLGVIVYLEAYVFRV